ncbi:hydrogen gas-evolving membrane-bound hydrogenase subunit E [Phytoactinopolyspora limicola]|uniref:hydrogen gas-evolving membrane-bound hydrogenase subunit E n=1 Tax=Phytoactinopolyspora limicola TaxID=2715536 RepID=UPI00140B0F50|nr:hydrogen gas-evolving membrane-bound hydrogenase subunit E [Phytoactinopolyspora limicola]
MILPVTLGTLAATALAAPALTTRLGRNAGYPIAAIFLALAGLIAAQAAEITDGGSVSTKVDWIPSIGVSFHLHLDGLSFLFAMLVLGVGALIMAYSPRYLKAEGDHGRFYSLLSLFAMSMLGLVLARDLVLLFIFWEFTTLSSFLLIGGGGLRAIQPATRAFVVTASGGLALLSAIVLMSVAAGTTDMTVIMANPSVVTDSPLAVAIAILILAAAFTKSAQLPFHFWLPDAMVAITPVSAYLHAATLVKGGIYLLMRFSPLFNDWQMWQVTLMTVGLTTAVIGALFALKQHDLKALLAYSTVSQLGFLIALVGVGTPAALAAAALHTFAHALFKATLFMLVGIIDREAGSRDVRELGGLRRVMPVTATLTGLAAMSMAGIPPFIGFVSKEEAYSALLDTPGPEWTGWLAALTAVCAAGLTFAYGFRIFYGAFAGPTTQRRLYEPSPAFLTPAAIPAALGLIFGLAVGVLTPMINRTVADTVMTDTDAKLSLWHGFSAPLALSAITIMIGLLLFFGRYPVDGLLHRHRLPITGAGAFDAIYQGCLRLGAWIGAPTKASTIGAHLAWPLAGVLALGIVGVLMWPDVPDTPVSPTRPEDWAVVGVLAVAVVSLCLVRSRISAIVLLGVVGFVVGIWFLIAGAPDLALTQLLVEILTVVVAVLVLRRLPPFFQQVRRSRKAVAAVAAVASGLVAGAATFLLTGRREQSPAAQYLMREAENNSGGRNVVNTVLVDFRALDTLGEVTVLAIAGLGLLTLLRHTAPPGAELSNLPTVRPPDRAGNMVIYQFTARLLFPGIAAIATFLLLRGHYEPGGGFIAALVAAVAVGVLQMPHGPSHPPRIAGLPLIRVGLTLSVLVGVWGLADGSFLRPLRGYLTIGSLDIGLSSSLLFDVGILLIVLGMAVVAFERLGRGSLHPAERSVAEPVLQGQGGERR